MVLRSFKKRGIDGADRGGRHRPHAGRRRLAARRCISATARTIAVEAVVSRSVAGPSRTACGAEAPESWSTTGASCKVDELMRTGEEGVFAVGDVVATPALAHVGFAEGVRRHRPDPRRGPVVPVDYGQGPVVHLLPSRGRLRRLLPRKRPEKPASTWWPRRTRYGGNGRALIIGEPEGLVKVIAEKAPDGTGRPHPRGPHGRAVGDRAARPGLPGLNWEATVDEARPFHPAPPYALGELRRDRARPHREREEASTLADITMPQLGETVTEGTITRWLKQVGDEIAEDDVLFEVSTDKVDSEVPSPVSGYLAEILVPEGDTVDVGTKLAVISADAPAGGAALATGAFGRGAGGTGRRARRRGTGRRRRRAGWRRR